MPNTTAYRREIANKMAENETIIKDIKYLVYIFFNKFFSLPLRSNKKLFRGIFSIVHKPFLIIDKMYIDLVTAKESVIVRAIKSIRIYKKGECLYIVIAPPRFIAKNTIPEIFVIRVSLL